MFFRRPELLAVGGAAQQDVYADTGWTAVPAVLREPPTATAWSHYAVQAVVAVPHRSGRDRLLRGLQQNWAAARPPAHLPQPIGPEQVWSVGQISHRPRRPRGVAGGAEPRAVGLASEPRTVHGNVAVDVEACSADRPTSAAAAIARQMPTGCPPPKRRFGTRLTNPIALGAPFGGEVRSGGMADALV